MEEIVKQAGAVTFRQVGDSFTILLIRAKKDPERWIFPKGHIEMGETAINTAERELHEEAGVIGTSILKIGELQYTANNRNYKVVYYINRFISSDDNGEPGRDPTWFSLEQALAKISFNNMKDLLLSAVPVIKQYLN